MFCNAENRAKHDDEKGVASDPQSESDIENGGMAGRNKASSKFIRAPSHVGSDLVGIPIIPSPEGAAWCVGVSFGCM